MCHDNLDGLGVRKNADLSRIRVIGAQFQSMSRGASPEKCPDYLKSGLSACELSKHIYTCKKVRTAIENFNFYDSRRTGQFVLLVGFKKNDKN